jgi:DNA-binding NarL/FixJ family response regulator
MAGTRKFEREGPQDNLSGPDDSGRGPMTERQCEVVRLVVLGSVEQAAAALQLHPYSIRRYLSEACRLCGVRSQAELVGWCVANSVVTVKELRGVYCRDFKVGARPKRQSEGPAAAGALGC